MSRVVGIDIGGTFTDFVSYDSATGAIENWKNLTTPADPIDGVLEGLASVDDLEGVRKIRLGTTIATNDSGMVNSSSRLAGIRLPTMAPVTLVAIQAGHSTAVAPR